MKRSFSGNLPPSQAIWGNEGLLKLKTYVPVKFNSPDCCGWCGDSLPRLMRELGEDGAVCCRREGFGWRYDQVKNRCDGCQSWFMEVWAAISNCRILCLTFLKMLRELGNKALLFFSRNIWQSSLHGYGCLPNYKSQAWNKGISSYFLTFCFIGQFLFIFQKEAKSLGTIWWKQVLKQVSLQYTQ